MRTLCLGLLCLLALLLSGACSERAERGERLEVFVSIPPQAYFVERVGGEHVSVSVLVAPGQEPHTFRATPKQVVALSRARLYFTVGVPFEERLVPKLEGREGLTVVDSIQGIERHAMGEHGHDHGADHEGAEEPRGHDDGGAAPDPHVWLSPPLIKIQAQNIAEALIAADPGNAEAYREGLEAFTQEIDATHARLTAVLAPFRGQAFYVFHPAFGYFADAYGLKQEAVEAEGKAPTPKRLSELMRRARDDGVRIIFVQPQFDKRAARSVADAIGGAVVPMDPLAGDVLKNLQDMASAVEMSLKGNAE